jgi:transketolase
MSNEPLEEKWRAFGWEVRRADGHDYGALAAALTPAGTAPCIVIADTVKGRGVSFMENVGRWHHGVPGEAELAEALRELEAAEAALREAAA